MKKFLTVIWLTVSGAALLTAYEVPLTGGASLNIPEAWTADAPEDLSWYSPDRRGAAELALWEAGAWDSLEELTEAARPEGAVGDIQAFDCWGGQAAIADWSFESGGFMFRGWFLFVLGTGPQVRISAIAAEEDFNERQPFLLSVLDSYIPGTDWALYPGAVSTFLELTGDGAPQRVSVPFHGETLSWIQNPAAIQAAQDVIEREALILSAYANVPDLFYPAWLRYYRLIFRDSYTRMMPVADALQTGPLPPDSMSERETVEMILSWLQSFSYGSVSGFSDLLTPAAACAASVGDCDSLGLALIILLDRYGTEGILILTQQALHAVAGIDIDGEGMRYSADGRSWLTAELTVELPPGVLPERLHGVSDWFGISLY